MCGICGFYTKQNISRSQLDFMNDLMKHRGPDDKGIELLGASDGYNIGMAHRRLSINDLSEMGHQPMFSPDGRLVVVFNGEIYNFHELKQNIRDYPYKGDSDTEVILSGFMKWGTNIVDHINGMYAIAIYDRDSENLYLIRDRIGKKPLYYWRTNYGLVFASELKPIMACPGFDFSIRQDILPRYLYQQYINAPDTIFENVYKLEPGTILTFNRGKLTKHKYWDVKDRYNHLSDNPVTDYNEARIQLTSILKKSVSERLVADVPIGTFLSGGYDSSLVTAMAQEISDEPVKTFSIGFREKEYDESVYAAEVAGNLGTHHTNLIIDDAMMLNMVSSIAQYYDEPMADSSQIPSMLVAELASKDVTVILTGDGGDEFFCGYGVYDSVYKAQKIDWIGAVVNKFPAINSHMPSRVREIADNRNIRAKTQFTRPYLLSESDSFVDSVDCIPIQYMVEQKYKVGNWQIRRMLLDMDTYLPGDILAKVDRATMKYGLEARCPILDTEVMEYSYRIPQKYKYFNKDKKHILKDIAYDYIPKKLLDRPKMGFGVPIDKWLKGLLKDQLIDYSDVQFLNNQGIFSAQFANKFVTEYINNETNKIGESRIVWSFFVFQQWCEYYSNMLNKFKQTRGGEMLQ